MKFINTKEFIRILNQNGFYMVRSNKHMIFSNGTQTVAVPHTKVVNNMLAKRLMKTFGMKK